MLTNRPAICSALALAAAIAAAIAFTASCGKRRDNRISVGSEYAAVVAYPGLRFDKPLGVAIPDDGTHRLMVIEQDGRLWAFNDVDDVATKHLVLDIRDRVRRQSGEEGLLGIAFHPAFRSNGFVYLNYTASSPARTVVSRFTITGTPREFCDPASELVLLEQPQPFGNHNGGCLQFGPDDGYLYVAFGDGGSGGDPHNNAQQLDTWLGKLLRIDVDNPDAGLNYGVPADNPFVESAGARPEIWAYGLRNPYRFSFDAPTGLLYAGDVGQNAFEEIDVIERGGNYGWRAFEAHDPYTPAPPGEPYEGPFIAPLHAYGHGELHCVIGGRVYRGQQLAGLQGHYIYADFSGGTLHALETDGETVFSAEAIATCPSPVSFGVDRFGELLIVSRDGHLYRLAFATDDGGGVPELLSDSGLFDSLDPLVAADGFVEYEVNVPLWSSGAIKRRWIRLPEGETVTVNPDGSYAFPAGTQLLKHFEMPVDARDPGVLRPVETRLLVMQPLPEVPLIGFTWVWDPDGQEAQLASGSQTLQTDMTDAGGLPVALEWLVPSGAACLACHTGAAGRVLGFTTPQLARGSQLDDLATWGVFAAPVTPAGATFQDWATGGGADDATLSRAWLDVNCSNCHRPDGPTPAAIDLRFATPLAGTSTVGVDPSYGELGIAGAKIIAAGDASSSVLPARMATTGPDAMPPIGHMLPDETALGRIRAWIDAMND